MNSKLVPAFAGLALCSALLPTIVLGETEIVDGFEFEVGADDALYTTYQFHSSPDFAQDIVVLGDGYQAGEFLDFQKSAGELIEELWEVDPFDDYKCAFNVWFVMPISAHAGMGGATPLQTSLGTSANGFGYITADASRVEAACIASGVPGRDLVVVIANEEDAYGAWTKDGLICMTSGYAMGAILAHEFGHVMATLRDEYDFFYGNSNDNNRSYTGAEPGYPNVTTYGALADTLKIPWYPLIPQWVKDAKFIPTDDMGSCICGTVGAWKGAGTYPNLYRPAEYCLMRRVCDITPFCAVCRGAIQEKLAAISWYMPLSCVVHHAVVNDASDYIDFLGGVDPLTKINLIAQRFKDLFIPPGRPVLVIFDLPPCFSCLPDPEPERVAEHPVRVTVGGIGTEDAELRVFDEAGMLVAGPVRVNAARVETSFTAHAGHTYRAALFMNGLSQTRIRLELGVWRDEISLLP